MQTTVREQKIRKAVVFSPAMAQYVSGSRDLRVVVDFVAVNAAEWRQYAETRPWPLSLSDYHWMTNLAPFDELLTAADELRAEAQ